MNTYDLLIIFGAVEIVRNFWFQFYALQTATKDNRDAYSFVIYCKPLM
jgi:hypothetical protein